MRTAVIYSPKYLEHKTGYHPENPMRIIAALSGLIENNLLSSEEVSLLEPRYASMEELQLVHTSEYIEKVRLICEAGGGLIDRETPVLRESFNVARLAAGGAIEATEKVTSGKFENAFVLARPPGHRAEPDRSLGFCIFNNVALTAKSLIEKNGLERILILDIDAHHGNGMQKKSSTIAIIFSLLIFMKTIGFSWNWIYLRSGCKRWRRIHNQYTASLRDQ